MQASYCQMSEVIRQVGQQQNSSQVLAVFGEYFRSLHLPLETSQQLFEGKAILKFLKMVKHIKNQETQQTSQIELVGSGMATFKKIVTTLETYEGQIFKSPETPKNDINLYEICKEHNESELSKLLIRIFKLAIQSPSREYFINGVMNINSNSQQILAQFLKTDGIFKNMQSPQRLDKSGVQKKSTSEKRKEDQIQLIDRIYEFEQQNEKLLNQLYQLQMENNNLNELLGGSQKNLEATRGENEQYRMLIVDYEEIIQNLKSKYQNQIKVEKIKETGDEMNKIVKQYNEKCQMLKLQNEGMKKKYEHKIKELNEAIKTEKQKNLFLTQNQELLKEELHQLILRCNETGQEIKDQNQLVQVLKQKNRQIEDKIAALKFQINYKDSQIEELKEFILNTSLATNRDEQSEIRKPLSLNDFNQQIVIPKTMFQVDIEELKGLRLQVKEMTYEINSLKLLKNQNKELQYQKKKLLKILRQCEESRGQENQILNGCLYQMRIKYKELKNSQKEDSTSCQKSIN